VKITASGRAPSDRLGDWLLVDGEPLSVTFPDGSTLHCLIRVIPLFLEGSHGALVRVTRAYMMDSVHGVPVMVPLSGLEAERIVAQGETVEIV
jgi:hypothetical protein